MVKLDALAIAAGIARFLKYVDKTSSPTGCWLWTGNSSGRPGALYGRFLLGYPERRSPMSAHRAAYLLFKGPVDDAVFVCHNCPGGDNTLCVNPAHLWLGTPKQNTQDMMTKGRHRKGGIRGDKNPRSLLNPARVIQMRRLYALGWPYDKLHKLFGVSKSAVWFVVKRRSWKWVR